MHSQSDQQCSLMFLYNVVVSSLSPRARESTLNTRPTDHPPVYSVDSLSIRHPYPLMIIIIIIRFNSKVVARSIYPFFRTPTKMEGKGHKRNDAETEQINQMTTHQQQNCKQQIKMQDCTSAKAYRIMILQRIECYHKRKP